ncbi:ABC transporter permease [Streptococcus pacificus]|uniref:ABC transporter permease n=1 Tax=Streptococcus pacificus TaxID=2740577 RepID=A0ABS0ZKI5_9STRE|nr:ABC transporter permease [Streptococcus pacificus]MBJ8326238.1 ABC transporter permease [Streptococcus pacificus]
MLRKIVTIFLKDAKIARRDAILSYMMVVPIILAVGILLLLPQLSENSFSIKTALLRTESKTYIDYMKKYTQVELFDNKEALENRLLKTDDSIGLISKNNDYEMIVEGNESSQTILLAQFLNQKFKEGANPETSSADIVTFKTSVNPLKTKLTNMLILLVIMSSGMMIALGLVEEKSDNTISAMTVSPVSQGAFILGKSLFGGCSALFGIIISLLILGYADINWFMLLSIGFMSFILSALVGFLQGTNSTDIIEVASSLKLMMLPIVAAVACYELLADNWQWTMYWNPFYWVYKANDLILSKEAIWNEMFFYMLIVFAISITSYFISIPIIKKKLRKA